MTSRQRIITPALMRTSLNELAHSLVRELSMAGRKVAIYGQNHPMSMKALDKPFLELEHVFRFKRFVNFNLQNGRLHVLNFRLRDSVFTDEIVQYMQVQEIPSFCFDRSLTISEFRRFMDRFVRRVNLTSSTNHMSSWLSQAGIASVEINTERVALLFEKFRHYRGDVEGDFSVKTLIANAIGDNPLDLADIVDRGQASLDERMIDFDADLVSYVIPERISSIPRSAIESLIKEVSQKAASGDVALQKVQHAIHRMLDFHPQKINIAVSTPDSQSASHPKQGPVTAIDVVKMREADKVLTAMECICHGDTKDVLAELFADDFSRLMRTGQTGLAISVGCDLIKAMQSSDASVRQRCLEIMLAIFRQVDCTKDSEFVDSIITVLANIFESRGESYEMADVVLDASIRLTMSRCYPSAAKLTSVLKLRRRYTFSGIEYDSIAIKKVADGLSRPEVLDILIDELIKSDHAGASPIRDIFIGIGTEAVALALSKIISHPIRQVRQQALRILAELGKSALSVFCQVVNDDSLFIRDAGRRELPDAKWYVARNSIFVLGSLRDPYAIAPLRLRVSDSDVRVRREIVSALEKIGGDDSVDMLVLMAEDSDREIRESAVAAIAQIANDETVPMIIDLCRRVPSLAPRIIAACGRIGGSAAQDFLMSILDDSDKQAELAIGGHSREDIRLSVIKALGQIGNQASLSKIKKFSESIPQTQKIFFKNSPLQKAITDILSRK